MFWQRISNFETANNDTALYCHQKCYVMLYLMHNFTKKNVNKRGKVCIYQILAYFLSPRTNKTAEHKSVV